MSYRLLPVPFSEEIIGDAHMLRPHTGLARFRAQAASQKLLKEGMQAIFLAVPVAGDGRKDVASNQRRQNYGATRLRIEFPANLHLDSLQQRNPQQEVANLFRFKSENLLR